MTARELPLSARVPAAEKVAVLLTSGGCLGCREGGEKEMVSAALAASYGLFLTASLSLWKLLTFLALSLRTTDLDC